MFAGRGGEPNLPISRAPAISSILSLIIIPILMGFFKDRLLQHPKKSSLAFYLPKKSDPFFSRLSYFNKAGRAPLRVVKILNLSPHQLFRLRQNDGDKGIMGPEKGPARPSVGKMVNQCQIKWKK